MSTTTRRRGKQQRSSAADAAGTNTSKSGDGAPPTPVPPPPASTAGGAGGADADAQVQQAIARVAMASIRTRDLHDMWRSTLHKMSYLVALLALHQLNGTVGQCVRDAKGVNDAAAQSSISGMEMIGLVLVDALPAILGVVVSGLLVKFLSLPTDEQAGRPADFGSPWYYVGAGMIPMIISLHFQTLNSGVDGSSAIASCVSNHEAASQFFDPGTEAAIAARVQKQIPVAIVYHAVVTVSYWLMKKGREQCDRNAELLRSLNGQIHDLKDTNNKKDSSKAKPQQKKAATGGSTKKKKKK